MIDKELKELSINFKEIKPYLLPAGGIFVIIFFSLTVFKNILNNWLKLRGQISKKKEKITLLTQKASQLEELDEQELQVQVNQLEILLPSKKAVLNAIISLSSLARETNVVLKNVTFKSFGDIETTKINENTFQLSFIIEGKMININVFFNRIVKIAPIMEIQDLGVSGLLAKDQEQKTIPSLSLKVNVFFKPTPQQIGAVDQPLPQITATEEKIINEAKKYIQAEIMKGQSPIGKDNLF